jgi:DNA uptake protein ComE-like DNA-binding protein
MKMAKSPEKEEDWIPEGVPGMHSGPGRTTNEWLALSKRKPSGSIRAADADANGDQPSKPRQSRSKKAASRGAQTNEWLAIPKPTPSGSSRAAPSKDAGDREPGRTGSQRDSLRDRLLPKSPSPKTRHRGNGVSTAVSRRRLSASLRKAKQDLQTKNAELSRLEGQLKDSQAEAAKLREIVESQAAGSNGLAGKKAGAEKPKRARSRRGYPQGGKLPKGKLDINALSFEQFRALGLSVTQSARLIALRDVNEGFSDIDELDTVVGFPAELRRDLKRRLVVRG